MLTFARIREMNLSRCNAWHGIMDWSVMEWACAMAGEAGEACNVAKKIKRVATGIAKRKGEDKLDLKSELAEELADTFIYLDLLAARMNIDLEAAIKKKFNSVSEEYSFPQRL